MWDACFGGVPIKSTRWDHGVACLRGTCEPSALVWLPGAGRRQPIPSHEVSICGGASGAAVG